MRTTSRVVLVVGLFGATCSSMAPAQTKIECVGMSEGYLTVAPVTGYPQPQAFRV